MVHIYCHVKLKIPYVLFTLVYKGISIVIFIILYTFFYIVTFFKL